MPRLFSARNSFLSVVTLAGTSLPAAQAVRTQTQLDLDAAEGPLTEADSFAELQATASGFVDVAASGSGVHAGMSNRTEARRTHMQVATAVRAAVWVATRSSQAYGQSAEAGRELARGDASATWDRFEKEMTKSGMGGTDWAKLKEQADLSSRDVKEATEDPVLAHAMTEALMGVLLKRSEIQAQCESTWLGYAASWALYPFSSTTQSLVEGSISVVKGEVVTAIDESVQALERSADLVLRLLLREACRVLTFSLPGSVSHVVEQLGECDQGKDWQLLKRVQALEDKVVGHDKGLSYQMVPTMAQLQAIIFKIAETRGSAKLIADWAAVLLGINLGAAQVENAALRGDLSAVRDKVWACGQMTYVGRACTPPWLTVRVPATLDGEERYVVQVFGSRFITGLLLHYADRDAYPNEEERSSYNPVSWGLGYAKYENPNRRGYPGGLGADLGETDQAKLKQRLLYWDPTTSISDWMGELCAHSKIRTGAHDCTELTNMILDVKSAVMLATAVQGTVSLIAGIGVSAKAGAAGAVLFKAGGASAGVSAAVKMALASAGIPGAAPVVLVTLASASIIGGAVWLVWRLRNTGVENLSSEDCLCGLLSTVTRPDSDRPGEVIPTKEKVGAGHALCNSGLGFCPTHHVMRARQDWDTLAVSFEEIIKRENCHLIEACSSAARDAFCNLEKNLAKTAKMCREHKQCSGEFEQPSAGDGRPVFNKLCSEFDQDKAGARMQQIREKVKEAKLEGVCHG